MKKVLRNAFTLSEILLVLSVIGVVASLTIPTLTKNSQDHAQKTAFKKAYSVASQAWMQVVAENPNTYTNRGGWSCTWPTGETADYSLVDGRPAAFRAKFNVVKSCINQDGCWPLTFEAHGTLASPPKTYAWISSDGMCWSAPWYGGDDTHLAVDTNCDKGPNLIGEDIFTFLLGMDGVVYFAIGDKSTTGKPVSSGNVCPYATAPTIINGRTVDFSELLIN